MKDASKTPRSRILWSLAFVVIAVASVYAIVSQSRSFTVETFAAFLGRVSMPWLFCGVAAMLGFIFFEGESVASILEVFGYRTGHGRALIYSASDIYFSAITPSATGGQPASAFFMIMDGVPPLVATVTLIVNLAMYTLSILVLGAVTLVTQPEIFAAFGGVSRALIAVGFAVQAALFAFFLMLLWRTQFMRRICSGGLRLLCRLHILRHEERRQEKLSRHMDDYAQYAGMIRGHTKALGKAFLFNLLQRTSVISVPFFLSLAAGGGLAGAARVWAVQCCTVLGSNIVPIPGAMGVSDYIMLDGFANFIPSGDVVDFELLSRAISFYICVLLCGALTLIKYIRLRRTAKK